MMLLSFPAMVTTKTPVNLQACNVNRIAKKGLPARSCRHGNSGRVAAVGEEPHFLVWWVLEILGGSQHICLFIESTEVL